MATANSKTQDKKAPINGAPLDGMKRHFAHEFGDAYTIHPRRKHWGPPAGMPERRQIMYSGRTDHKHAFNPPPGWAAPQAPTAQAQAPAPAQVPQVRTQAAPELAGEAIARALIRAMAWTFGPALARALDETPQARAELLAALGAPAQAHQETPQAQAAQATIDQARAEARTDSRLADAMRADQEAERAQAQARTRRTRKPRAQAQEPAQETAPATPAAQVGRAPARAAQAPQAAPIRARGADRRAANTKPVDDNTRRELRRYFTNLDLLLADEKYDELTEDQFDFGTHTEEYKKCFLWHLHQDATARQAHNAASLHAYGNEAIVI